MAKLKISALRATQTAAPAAADNFHRRYGELECQRAALLTRLESLGGKARRHPSHGRAVVLINDTFRKSSVAQRRAVLNAADWLIGLIERMTDNAPASLPLPPAGSRLARSN